MFGIQTKITRHAKKRENMIDNEDNNESLETDTEVVDENIKRIIKTVFCMFKNLKRHIENTERSKWDF